MAEITPAPETRKAHSQKRRRATMIGVWVTDAERDGIRQAANRGGLTVSEFLRRSAALGANAQHPEDPVEVRVPRLVDALGKAVLNQIREHPKADNYLQWLLESPDGRRVVIYAALSEGQTPHALKVRAEERVQRVRDFIDQMERRTVEHQQLVSRRGQKWRAAARPLTHRRRDYLVKHGGATHAVLSIAAQLRALLDTEGE